MESLETAACFRDDLLDFPSDISDDDDDSALASSSRFSLPVFPEFMVEEEELEWISNKDAFPIVESFVDIMPNHPSISLCNSNNNVNSFSGNNLGGNFHSSPVSVLENSGTTTATTVTTTSSCSGGGISSGSSIPAMVMLPGMFKVPGKARSRRFRKRRREITADFFQCWEKEKPKPARAGSWLGSGSGRKCSHCGTEKTPQWRAGPSGPKTLCNACGVRYKSGRLVPEYRPASSPTFSSELHSNSHRKVIEMRRQKMMFGGGG